MQAVKGTKDFLPEEMILRERIIENFKQTFELFGFQPMETPSIEEWNVLAKKGGGGEDILSETFSFEDKGKRKIGLRYDLTIPLARVIASNPTLPLPFKRYQIGKVWRYGEVSKGRLREFLQCDIDIIGSESMLADAEVLACATKALESINLKNFFIRLNNRKILSGIISYVEIDENASLNVIRTIDKLDKIGLNNVEKKLKELNIQETSIKKILDFIKISGEPKDVLKKVEEIIGNFKNCISEMEELLNYLKMFNIYEKVKFDISLARGLDYYTGPIFEISARKEMGSIAGGGRYDKLIGLFAGKDIPATGISLGFERIFELIKENKNIETPKTKIKAYIVTTSEKLIENAIKIANELRKNNIATDFNIRKRSLEKQLEYADSLQIPYVIIIGEKELKNNVVKVKDMKQRKEMEVKIDELVKFFYLARTL
ncbi:MAG: histidine--tRNA ligase [Candidatus Aenigmatarchaeota archaeon]